MDKKVKRIILEFENCESIPIEREFIGVFWCTGIRSEIGRVAVNSIRKWNTCKELFIEISKSFDSKYTTCFGDEMNAFERLSIPDIVDIVFQYEDETEERIFVPWKGCGSDDSTNKYEKSYISKFEHFYIAVSKKKDLIGSYMELINTDGRHFECESMLLRSE